MVLSGENGPDQTGIADGGFCHLCKFSELGDLRLASGIDLSICVAKGETALRDGV